MVWYFAKRQFARNILSNLGDMCINRKKRLTLRNSFYSLSHFRRKKSGRVPPEGRDAALRASGGGGAAAGGQDRTCPNKFNQTMARDEESMDSIVNWTLDPPTGSMVDLVKGAREVRRLIREASFDSLASEFSLDFQVR